MVGDNGSTSFEMQNMTIREDMQSKAQPSSDATDVVVLHQADFSANRIASVLSNISLKLPRGSLTLVVGPVGSGKSMLLKAILGELYCTKGYMQMQSSLKVSYCDAHSWVRHKSILENILGPLEYDEEWYQTVVRACALEEDLNSLPQGHFTLIGSNGTSISGGQRQRIAIARALYARTQLALFDGVLSALDARTNEHILTHVFGDQGLLRQHGVTVVLVTHVDQNLTFVDQMVVIDNGKIVECGRPQAVAKSTVLMLIEKMPSHDGRQTAPSAAFDNQQPTIPPASYAVENITDRKLGDLTNYSYYLKAAGTRNILLYFMCLVIRAFCSQSPSKYIPYVWIQVFLFHMLT
jgi:ABC-type multidrug transport system fused ATPase/permease subunit